MADPKNTELTLVQYQVRKIERYIVTRYHESGDGRQGSEGKGEYSSPDTAFEVGNALCRAEHERLGWPIADERIQYPRDPTEAAAQV